MKILDSFYFTLKILENLFLWSNYIHTILDVLSIAFDEIGRVPMPLGKFVKLPLREIDFVQIHID